KGRSSIERADQTRLRRRGRPDDWHGERVAARAIVLVPVLQTSGRSESPAGRQARGGNGSRGATLHSPEDRLAEAASLAEAIDLEVRAKLIVPVARPQPATLFGSGKVAELKDLVAQHE